MQNVIYNKNKYINVNVMCSKDIKLENISLKYEKHIGIVFIFRYIRLGTVHKEIYKKKERSKLLCKHTHEPICDKCKCAV
jgi:hypothetical protein